MHHRIKDIGKRILGLPRTGIEPKKPWLGGFSIGGDPETWSPRTWQIIVKDKDIKRVLDIGCAEGHHLRWFLENGLTAVGIDGSQLAYKHADPVAKGSMRIHDFTQGPFAFGEDDAFDLGWCVEFVEHVEERFIPHFMAAFRRCRYVAMTHASPGQRGYHHVNEQPRGYWIAVMEANGFAFDEAYTAYIKEHGDGEYVKKTFLFFENRDPSLRS